MKQGFKTTFQRLLGCPAEFPVEALLGVSFFIIATWNTATRGWDDSVGQFVSGVNSDILALFVPLMVLTFFLHKVNRWAYIASYFLFLPLMLLNLKPFLWSTAFSFTYVLAGILLIIGTRRMDNPSFARQLLHVVTQLFFGLLISGLLNIAVYAIVASFFYIFGIKEPDHIYQYMEYFIWFVIAPLMCCFFITRREEEVLEGDGILSKPLRIILNFILSPAIIIYTVILYAYFIMIAVTWNLPKGGVAYMVMAFITASLAGRLVQEILPRRYFDWFYGHFTWIAVPPLIMYWIGSLYRIRLYSFTEGRFYLLVAGALMTLFVFMLLWKRSRRYQLMAFIFGCAIILFTYIPGISAKSVGIRCQQDRLAQFIQELNLNDEQTGKFREHFDIQKIRKDSLLNDRYMEVSDIIGYLKKEVGDSTFTERYGKWPYRFYRHNFYVDNEVYGYDEVETHYAILSPVNLGDYTLMLLQEDYDVSSTDSTIVVKNKAKKTVLEYHVIDSLRAHPELKKPTDRLNVYHNDSLLLVLPNLILDETSMTVSTRYFSSAQIFRRNGGR